MNNTKPIKKNNILRYTDSKDFRELEDRVISELSQKNELLKNIFAKNPDFNSVQILRKYLENPLLYGIYTEGEEYGPERFTITLIPTADEQSWSFNRFNFPEIGIYQDRSHGIGLLRVLHMAKPGIRFNQNMIFECEYLYGFFAAKSKVNYFCTNPDKLEDSWEVKWSKINNSDTNNLDNTGTAKLYLNTEYMFGKESKELYNMNIEKLYLLNSDNPVKFGL